MESNLMDFEYSKCEIPQELIDECELLSLENDETYFIFDRLVSDRILLNKYLDKGEKRDDKIDKILYDGDFHIDTEDAFKDLPSRYSYYDTNIKIIDKYKRYNHVIDFILKIGFRPSEWNLGREYEQSFMITEFLDSDNNFKWNLTVKPNMFIKISYYENYATKGSFGPIFNGFFNKFKILDALENSNNEFFKSLVRDIKIESIGL